MPNYPYTFQLPPLNVQDIPNDGVAGEFLGINGSGVLDWLPAGGGDMLKADNLLGLTSYPTARTNLGLGTGDSPTFANLTLTSPSLVSSAPVTISQTWNNAAVAFTGLRFNAAGTSATNSAAGSILFDLQVGGATKVSVNKDGAIGGYAYNGLNTSGGGTMQVASGNATFGYHMARDYCVTWGGAATLNGSIEVSLCRDGAPNTLALRNGALAQTFRVYGAYPDTGINYARLALSCDTSGNATISTQALGTYTAGTVSINGVPVGLGNNNQTGNVSVGTLSLRINTSGTYNTAVGRATLYSNTTGYYNTSVGNGSLYTNSTGYQNTAIGEAALDNNSTGATNVAVGHLAGSAAVFGQNTICNNSVFLGVNTKVNATSETNQIVIGHTAVGIGSNSVVLGNDSITKTALKGNVGIGTTNPTSNLTVAQRTAGVGTISVDAAGTTVTGAGTQFLNTFAAGQTITSAGQTLTISAIASDTSMTISPAAGAAISGQAYTLVGGTRFSVAGHGDIEVNTASSGLILKSPDGTRYRVTVPNGGTVLTITAV